MDVPSLFQTAHKAAHSHMKSRQQKATQVRKPAWLVDSVGDLNIRLFGA